MAKSQQLLTAPVYGLRLSEQVKHEIKVGRVTFISAEKIPRVRKRLGLKHPVSHYREQLRNSQFGIFNNARTYAVIKAQRDPANSDLSSEFREIQRALWLLASSFASNPWRQDAAMSLRPSDNSMSVRDVSVFDRTTDGYKINYRFNAARQPNRCEGFWLPNAKREHFINLLKIIDGKLTVTPKWKSSLVRASTLFGQSYMAKHLAEAFTYNMIAIEILLSERGDKFPNALVDRIVAIFGWLHNEDREPWEESISRLYQLRCGYVHDGHAGDITGLDLFSSDRLLQNLLTNLCSNTKHIKSKTDIVDLADRLAAYQTLGKSPKREARFSYSTISITPNIQEKIDDTSKWEW